MNHNLIFIQNSKINKNDMILNLIYYLSNFLCYINLLLLTFKDNIIIF
jgi:hypothetical protein